jgi:hypothetical protein
MRGKRFAVVVKLALAVCMSVELLGAGANAQTGAAVDTAKSATTPSKAMAFDVVSIKPNNSGN